MSEIQQFPSTSSIDFKIIPVPHDDTVEGHKVGVLTYGELTDTLRPGALKAHILGFGNFACVEWYVGDLDDDSSLALHTWGIVINTWYTFSCRWDGTEVHYTLATRDDDTFTQSQDDTTGVTTPYATASHYAGFFGNGVVSYEVVIDNGKLQVHCNEDLGG